jgi:lipid-binding SYLF domain-containing protein
MEVAMSRLRGVSVAFVCIVVAACASGPKTVAERDALTQRADQVLATMTATDPSLRPLLDTAAGYVIFPDVKQGGFVVGGASGRGVLYERGVPVGFADLSQASVGAQVGGQTYAELVVLRDQFALDRIRSGNFKLGAQASATALTAGAATATRFGESGMAVFVKPWGGAMLNVSLTGQTIRFRG